MLRLRAALQLRGGGLLPLAKAFKEFDTDNSGQLNWEEFCGALRKCGLTLTPQDIRQLFLQCDKDGNNEISLQEFIESIRGQFSNSRKDLVSRVFASIDKDSDGVISMSDVGACVNARMHPLVKSGKLSVNEALSSILDDLTSISNNGYINLAQFVDFYANLAAFDEDSKFEENLTALWKIKSLNTLNASQQTLRTLVDGRNAQSNSNADQLINKLRDQLAAQGARGIIGLSRKFRIMDDDDSKTLSQTEFRKGLKELKLALSESEILDLFAVFDKDRDGSINYDEFLSGVRGVLDPRRKALVDTAFNILDKSGDGIIDVDEIISVYNADKHPDVLSGKRTANEVLREFLDTFDVGGVHDGKVTRQEFENYYANISASIDSDDYFELMMRNAWHITGGTGWSANSANRRVLVTRADGSESVEEIKQDLGLKSDDKQGMMNRLKAQGVDASSVGTTYGSDNRDPIKNNKSNKKFFATVSQIKLG